MVRSGSVGAVATIKARWTRKSSRSGSPRRSQDPQPSFFGGAPGGASSGKRKAARGGHLVKRLLQCSAGQRGTEE